MMERTIVRTLVSVSLILLTFLLNGCGQEKATWQEVQTRGWRSSHYDDDHRIAQALTTNAAKGCAYYRFKSLEKDPGSRRVVWVECENVQGSRFHYIVWPGSKKLAYVLDESQVRRHL
ncbi:hypothetical protein [Ferrimonas balearica]|uniref:hypothetical protein n=1 Tax=Ferrimonas balearica TaxID=44012 RepID=UPI001C960F7A|nr:hypothetical protein [Ferrimonas balearica]MBY6223581.1 hypothetical protein [Ferrimonas balearica]